MAGHRLRGAEDQLPRLPTEHRLHRRRLGGIAVRCRCAVRVDVADLLGPDAARLHREPHGFLGAGAIGSGCGDVMRVGRRTVAYDLGDDLRAP